MPLLIMCCDVNATFGISVYSKAVVPKLGGTHNIESGACKNYGNAQKLNYQLMTFFVLLCTI
jgi:hypothetical protein